MDEFIVFGREHQFSEQFCLREDKIGVSITHNIDNNGKGSQEMVIWLNHNGNWNVNYGKHILEALTVR